MAPVVRRLSWQALTLPQPITPGAHNILQVQREVVPIVFVPGLMGTRLRSALEPVWDPDCTLDFLRGQLQIGRGKDHRARRILGPQGFCADHLFVDDDEPTLHADGAVGRGWGALVQGNYGALRGALAQPWAHAVQLCFELPAYAFGYNWVRDIDETALVLRQHIDAIVAHHARAQPCRFAIVVTHSMGGIVARAAAHLHRGAARMLGIVHVGQPAAGAPAAYARMKAGFELGDARLRTTWQTQVGATIASALLGSDGPAVTALLANMPGALALLPTHLYADAQGDPGWLTLTTSGACGAATDALPKRGDPYEEIYRQRHHAWRLVDPALLRPGSHDVDADWAAYLQHLGRAERLQRALGSWHHPNTHHVVGEGLETYERSGYALQMTGCARTPEGAGPMRATLDSEALVDMAASYTTRAFAARKALHPGAAELRLRTDVTPHGDGTVPFSSATLAHPEAAQTTVVPGLEHAGAMLDVRVLRAVRSSIEAMAQQLIAREAQGVRAGG